VDIRVLANDTDPNGLHLTIYGASKPSHGTIVILAEEGIIRYTPESNWYGTDTFTYTVVNAEGLTSQARVTVTVRAVQQEVNHNPVAKNDTATTGKNNAIKIYVLANDYDTDGDRLNIGSVTQPRNGKVTINSDRTVTYTPNKDFSGTDTFTYTVIEKGGNSVSIDDSVSECVSTTKVFVRSVGNCPIRIDRYFSIPRLCYRTNV